MLFSIRNSYLESVLGTVTYRTVEIRSFLFSQGLVKAGMLPYWDVDPEELGAEGEIGPFLNLDVEFKNNDKAVDVTMETRAGTDTFNDVPLRLGDYSKRMRNLKFTSTLKRLFDSKIISELSGKTKHFTRCLFLSSFPQTPAW